MDIKNEVLLYFISLLIYREATQNIFYIWKNDTLNREQ